MTWDDWNPYLGVDYRLMGAVAVICLLGAVILEIGAFRRRKALFVYPCAGRQNDIYSGSKAGEMRVTDRGSFCGKEFSGSIYLLFYVQQFWEGAAVRNQNFLWSFSGR